MLQRNSSRREAAEAMAVRILGFLASDSSRLESFLRVSGMEPHEVRQAAESAGFLAGVMDYALQDEKLLLSFCESEGIDPALIGQLRRSLPGVAD
jgi:zinc transporter ZupT